MLSGFVIILESKLMSKILISGATGLVGSALVNYLKEQGHQIVTVSHKESKIIPDDEISAIINLSGANIGKRWTKQYMKEILDSRVTMTNKLVEAAIQMKTPPKVFLNASAIGYYGGRGDEICTDDTSKGHGFLSDVCQKWEAATIPASQAGIRVCCMRFGVILSPNGGALAKMLLPFKLGLGGVIGDGSQYMSWVALEDVVRAIDYLLKHENISGAINVTSPFPVTNEEFTKTLASLLHRPSFCKVPAFALKLILGKEMAKEMFLNSTRAIPQKLIESGFTFDFPHLHEALIAQTTKT